MEFNDENQVFITAVDESGTQVLSAGVYPDKENGGFHLRTIIQNPEILPVVDKEIIASFLRKALKVEVDASMITDDFVEQNVFLLKPDRMPQGRIIGQVLM